MTATFVQAAKLSSIGTPASLTATFGAGTTAGNFVVVASSMSRAATSITITNNSNPGDTVTSVTALFDDVGSGAKSTIQVFLAPTAGSTAFLATFAGSPTVGEIYIWEFSGLASPLVDKAVHASGTAATADSGSSGTLSSSDQAAIGYGVTTGGFSSAGAGWSVVAGDGISPQTSDIGEHRVVASNTAINATSASSGTWIMHLATFMSGITNTIMIADQARS